MSEEAPIALVLKPNLWRVIVVNDVANPQRVRNITVKGPATARGAIDSALHTDAFEDFKKEFPLCGIAKIEFMGLLDNA